MFQVIDFAQLTMDSRLRGNDELRETRSHLPVVQRSSPCKDERKRSPEKSA